MIPIPAIDLKGGKVVRLLQGNFDEEKIYFDKPEITARRFAEDGAVRIHVVDLDGALKGTPKNIDQIETILKYCKTPLEVGGGIRSLETIERYLEMGIGWVILGTKACLDFGFLEEALSEFKEKVIVGIDALEGFIATDGWTKKTTIKAIDFAKQVEGLGGKTIIYTDIATDGLLKGPNIEGLRKMSEAVGLSVIASGGVSGLSDIEKILALKRKNIEGVIIGKALYEKKLNLKDAIKLCHG